MSLEKLSQNLNILMAESQLNVSELARRAGIPPSSIKNIKNNDQPNPTLSTLFPLASYFSISVSQLIGEVPLKLPFTVAQNQIPIIMWSQIADWPNIQREECVGLLSERKYGKNVFALIIDNDINMQFKKGTAILVDPEVKPVVHDYAILLELRQNTPSIKQILIEDNKTFLKSLLLDNHIIEKDNHYKVIGTITESRLYFKE